MTTYEQSLRDQAAQLARTEAERAEAEAARDHWIKVAEERQEHLDWWNATQGIGPHDVV